MADTFPLKNTGPTPYTGKSPSAVTNEAQRYKNMLGFQAASEDVGLFYQLNQNAIGNTDIRNIDPAAGRPIEAGGVYT